MACFLVPATEAAVTTIAEHVVKGKEERANKEELTLSENSKTPFSHKLKWLNHMLWGGSALLAFEHIWHGEVTPWFPFLTAAGNPRMRWQCSMRWQQPVSPWQYLLRLCGLVW